MEVVRRGYIPGDAAAFGPSAREKLRQAGEEICFLLNRGYDMKSVSTFVGNHYLLSERQRLALARILSSRAQLSARRSRELTPDMLPERLWIDGFNIIITLEVALSGSLLLRGMDGTVRDLAGLRGTYRIVDKTLRAAKLLVCGLERLGVQSAVVYLDAPVSNSGRLRQLILEQFTHSSVHIEVELHPGVDSLLYGKSGVITSDAIILDHCESWYNLGRDLIARAIPDAWIFDLQIPADAPDA